jgi:hypothetical protein
LGYTGIWLGINASDIVQGIGMILIFCAGHWQKAFKKHKKKLAQGVKTGEVLSEYPSSGS